MGFFTKLLTNLLTLGTSTTATPDARDATPAGKASLRDALLALVVVGGTAAANAYGVPITEGDTTKAIAELAGAAAVVFGVVQYMRRKVADRAAVPPVTP